MTPLLEENVEDRLYFAQTNVSIASRFFAELVDILVNNSDLSRENAERLMQDGTASLRPEFANVAKHVAFNYFAVLLSSASVGTDIEAQRRAVMQALHAWEHTCSTNESSQCGDGDECGRVWSRVLTYE